MTHSSNGIRMLRTMLGAVVLLVTVAIGSIAQLSGNLPRAPTQGAAKAAPSAQTVPPCAPLSSNSSPGHASSQSNPSAHSVTLSWKASVPRSNSKQDAIQGYYIYRSGTSNTYADSNRMNANPLRGTQCIDTAVSPRGKYFYVVRSIAGNKIKSAPSNEAAAVIPFP